MNWGFTSLVLIEGKMGNRQPPGSKPPIGGKLSSFELVSQPLRPRACRGGAEAIRMDWRWKMVTVGASVGAALLELGWARRFQSWLLKEAAILKVPFDKRVHAMPRGIHRSPPSSTNKPNHATANMLRSPPFVATHIHANMHSCRTEQFCPFT